MHALKLTQIGNSVGVILPKDVLAKLKVEKGDMLYVTESPSGVTLTPYDPALEEQLSWVASSCTSIATRSGRLPSELALGGPAPAVVAS